MTTLEWQAAEGSRTVHVLDLDRPQWKNPDGSRRLNGPRSLCGRYPQRNAESPWFTFPVGDPLMERDPLPYVLKACPDCREKVPA